MHVWKALLQRRSWLLWAKGHQHSRGLGQWGWELGRVCWFMYTRNVGWCWEWGAMLQWECVGSPLLEPWVQRGPPCSCCHTEPLQSISWHSVLTGGCGGKIAWLCFLLTNPSSAGMSTGLWRWQPPGNALQGSPSTACPGVTGAVILSISVCVHLTHYSAALFKGDALLNSALLSVEGRSLPAIPAVLAAWSGGCLM